MELHKTIVTIRKIIAVIICVPLILPVIFLSVIGFRDLSEWIDNEIGNVAEWIVEE